MIARACERNVSAEFRFKGADGRSQTVRARLIAVSPDGLYIDSPQRGGTPVSLRRNQRLEGHFPLDGRRYRFVTRVQVPHLRIQLNRERRVAGVRLDPPESVEEHQRRRDYRVLVISRHTIPVFLVCTDPLIPNACPIHAPRYETRLVDISARGICVLGRLEALRGLKLGDCCYASVKLPGAEERLSLLVEVRHVCGLPKQELCRVGCATKQWTGSNGRRDSRVIQQFVAQEQRALLAGQRR